MNESIVDEAFIRYVGLTKSFGDKQVLRGVDLVIPRGETEVVLGGSGSGKSVLLRHTIGLHRPDDGAVWVDGQDITGLGEERLIDARKKVGMLFQAGRVVRFDDGRADNVAYALREHTELQSEEEIAERVGPGSGARGTGGTSSS